jgi:hypothetical protein
MVRLGRKWRILKWTGLVLSLLIFVVWAASAHWRLVCTRLDKRSRPESSTVYPNVLYVCIEYGYLELTRSAPPSQGMPNLEWFILRYPEHWLPPIRSSPTILLPSYGTANGLSLRVPLWIPFLIFAMPTTYLWWRDRRRRIPPGHCRKCGYDLTGNVSGICPECGVKMDAASAPKG